MTHSNSILALFLSILFIICSCDKTEEPAIAKPNGEFTIKGETYQLSILKRLYFGSTTRKRDVRLLFLSKSYPIEGEDVENLHFIGIDLMISNEDVTGHYSVTGNSNPNSIVYAYGGTNMTLENQELLSGTAYEFEKGELLVSKNEDEYSIEIHLIDSVGAELIGKYIGPIQ
ncbi:MAG: hypothetical protein RIC03_12185 [Cyclobacteriaceae bacterium]